MTTEPTHSPHPAPGTTHSPAPWRVRGQSKTGRHITVTAANGRTVALVPWNAPYTPVAECTDARDALTISLAPQALSALEDALAALKSAKNFIRVQYGSTNPAREQAIEMAEAVLTRWKAAL